jgi:hypothetical protein
MAAAAPLETHAPGGLMTLDERLATAQSRLMADHHFALSEAIAEARTQLASDAIRVTRAEGLLKILCERLVQMDEEIKAHRKKRGWN